MSYFGFLFSIWALFSASIAFHWAPLPKDGDVIYACDGVDVTFPWAYTLSPGEEITSMEWLYDGVSQEIIAILTHDVFVPLPAFSGRVHQTANGGLVLSHVTTGDAGNYTVEVNVRGSPDFFIHTLFLHVSSGLPTSDGLLHVQQEPDAEVDSTTQQWSLVLSCGSFIHLAHPPFFVEWLSPSGQVLTSTGYKGGNFQLHLANSIEDGSYTCRVSQQHVASACLHGDQNATGSVTVNRMEARMTLMEAEMTSLRHDKLQLEQQVASFDTRFGQMMDNVTRMLQGAVRTPLVGFNAQSTTNQVVNPPTYVKFNNVLYNAGQGYGISTGVFTAPTSGTYFFIFQTRSDVTHGADSSMQVNGNEVCRSYVSNTSMDHGACSAVVHMTKGDRAWIQPYGSSPHVAGRHYSAFTTSFAGFLFYAEP